MLTLHSVDESAALPLCADAAELLASADSGGQCELLPGSHRPVNSWYPGCVGAKAGPSTPRWWKDSPRLHLNPVHLYRVRDAYYAPTVGALISSRGEVMESSVAQARFVTPDLSGLPHARKVDGEIRFDPPDVPLLDRIIVTMPLGATRNYGHFVCDCLTTVALTTRIPVLRDYAFAFPTLREWQKRHLELVGVGNPIQLDAPLYRVSDVIFSNAMARFLHYPNVSYRMLRDVELRNHRRASPGFKRIYVSRAGATKHRPTQRIFISEPELERRLAELGFAIVLPENHSVDEQIAIFHGADLIVGCWGAAMANTIYCHADATIVEILPTVAGMQGYKWVRNICAINGYKWRPYFCLGIRSPDHNPGAPQLGFTFQVDVDDVVDFASRSGQT
jgi:capsular polysaccharide biosynthesis protein